MSSVVILLVLLRFVTNHMTCCVTWSCLAANSFSLALMTFLLVTKTSYVSLGNPPNIQASKYFVQFNPNLIYLLNPISRYVWIFNGFKNSNFMLQHLFKSQLFFLSKLKFSKVLFLFWLNNQLLLLRVFCFRFASQGPLATLKKF